jgi:ATP-dependent protease ClpP protease subunit
MTDQEKFIIQDLEELEKKYNDPNFLIVIHSLGGSILSGQAGLLADKVREFTKDVLIPSLKKNMENDQASKN